jgi:HD-GYP domain-containing protein (c-di-GMP phosphodiesterase class II)
MIANRPYRAGVEATLALDELTRCAGTQFDPAVTEAFGAAWLEREALEPAVAS